MNFREQKGRNTWENKLGNKVTDLGLFLHIDRYIFDSEYCASEKGWKQYDTTQDASYFGIWVHLEDRLILTYCEGDLTLVDCPDNEHLKAELNAMAKTCGMIHKKARDLKLGDQTPWYAVYEYLNPCDFKDEKAEVIIKVQYTDGGIGIRCWDDGNHKVSILTGITVTCGDGAREIEE